MKTIVDEIENRIYRLSTYVPQAGPAGFTFNQFFIDAEEPLLICAGSVLGTSRLMSAVR